MLLSIHIIPFKVAAAFSKYCYLNEYMSIHYFLKSCCPSRGPPLTGTSSLSAFMATILASLSYLKNFMDSAYCACIYYICSFMAYICFIICFDYWRVFLSSSSCFASSSIWILVLLLLVPIFMRLAPFPFWAILILILVLLHCIWILTWFRLAFHECIMNSLAHTNVANILVDMLLISFCLIWINPVSEVFAIGHV